MGLGTEVSRAFKGGKKRRERGMNRGRLKQGG